MNRPARLVACSIVGALMSTVALAQVNLQPTPHDSEASVRVHGRCDRVRRSVLRGHLAWASSPRERTVFVNFAALERK